MIILALPLSLAALVHGLVTHSFITLVIGATIGCMACAIHKRDNGSGEAHSKRVEHDNYHIYYGADNGNDS